MRKFILPILSILIWSCSSDSELFTEELIEDNSNKQPVINAQSLSVNEHAESGTSIGTIAATDGNNDELTFTINSESNLEINETTGEITIGENLVLDFESATSLMFTVSVSDGTATSEQEFELVINDIDEFELLNDSQKEIINYFNYLTLWQSPTHTALENSSRWVAPMNIYFDGGFNAESRTIIENVIEEYNTLFINSDFNITIVDTIADANVHLYLGEVQELEQLWADMYEIVNGKTFSGYAMTVNNNSVLSESRIWISSSTSILFKHELGHALGFGHSDKCESENSFMCSNISTDHDFLEMEKKIIPMAYDNEMLAGLTAEEIKLYLANKMVLEN